jgi:Ca2+-binding RTX toxin-like protein
MAYSFTGNETLINTSTVGAQREAAGTPLPGGRVLVVWVGRAAGSSHDAIKGQIYDSAGNRIGPEITFESGDFYFSPTATVHADGGFSVAWSTARSQHIATYDAGGSFAGQINYVIDPGPTPSDFRPATMASATLPGGTQVFVGAPRADGFVTGLLVQPNGTQTNFFMDGRSPAVTALDNGNFVLVTADQGGTGSDQLGYFVRGQVFNASGVPVSPEFVANTTAPGNQTSPAIATLESGNFVVVWADSNTDGSGHGIRGQLFAPNGSKIGSEFAVNTIASGNQIDPTVAATGDGGFVVSWTDASGVGDTSGTGIKAQIFDSAGAKVGGELTANNETANDQDQPFLVTSPAGDVFVLWTDDSGTGGDAAPPGVKIRILSDAINGTDASETIFGTPGDDVIRARGGNDVVRAEQGGVDIVEGGDGNDILYFGSTFTSADDVYGGAGRDTLALQGVYNLTLLDDLWDVEVIALMTSADNNYGGASGTPNRYTLQSIDQNVAPGQALTIEARALAANESVAFYGAAETDGQFAFFGGAGNDYFEGGSGNDTFNGGLGADTMIGNLGNDTFFVNTAADIVRDAGAGFDSVYTTVSYALAADAQIERLATTNSASTTAVALTGNGFAQTIIGTEGADTLRGLAGNDFLIGNGGADQLYGGIGIDVMQGGAGNDVYFVEVAADTILEAAGEGNDTVYTERTFVLLGGVSVELLIYQGSTAVALYGNEFGQTIRAGAGSDSIEGRAGDDYLVGFEGNDRLDGGAGVDVLEGGEGSDVYFVDQAADVVIETGSGYDSVYASGSFALAVNVEVELLATNGSSLTTAIDLTGSDTGQTIVGNAGVNMIVARGGNDFLRGHDGDDMLDGGSGVDILEGGAGADIFRFAAASDTILAAGDQIRDFVSGTDRIDLSAIDADTGAAGDQAFTYIGANAFTGQAGQLRSEIANGQVHVTGDVNGDGLADFHVVLNNTTLVAAGDFML